MRIESRDQFEALRTQSLEIDADRKQQVLGFERGSRDLRGRDRQTQH